MQLKNLILTGLITMALKQKNIGTIQTCACCAIIVAFNAQVREIPNVACVEMGFINGQTTQYVIIIVQ